MGVIGLKRSYYNFKTMLMGLKFIYALFKVNYWLLDIVCSYKKIDEISASQSDIYLASATFSML